MFKIRLGYPTREQEARIVRLTTATLEPPPAPPVASRAELLGFQTVVAHTDVAPDLLRFAVDLVRASRPAEATAPPTVRDYVTWGAGPRAAQALLAGARARALLRGRPGADAEDVRALAPAVFRHRYVMSYAAEADGVAPDDVTKALLEAVPGPGGPPSKDEPGWVKRLWSSLRGPSS
jgi:MoxR-like ATPase